jgi:hypothetical protein
MTIITPTELQNFAADSDGFDYGYDARILFIGEGFKRLVYCVESRKFVIMDENGRDMYETFDVNDAAETYNVL